MANTSSSPSLRFAVLATDVTLFTLRDGELCVRLMDIHRPPYFTHRPGLPGGLIHPNETADEAAERIAAEKGAVSAEKVHLEQLYTFSGVNRDPRGRVVAVGYLGLVPYHKLSEAEAAATEAVYWQPVRTAKKLAYDHDEILATAVTRLRSRIRYTTLISKLMPKEFTLTELETAFETITGNELDKRNFRKKILKLGILEATSKKRALGPARPAELYRFASLKVSEIEIL